MSFTARRDGETQIAGIFYKMTTQTVNLRKKKIPISLCFYQQNLSERGSFPDEGGISGIQAGQGQATSPRSSAQQTGSHKDHVTGNSKKMPPPETLSGKTWGEKNDFLL